MINDAQIELESKFKLANEAIKHVLNAIADDPRKYWLMGPMTGSYEKLTAAGAEIWQKPLEEIQKSFRPPHAAWDRYCVDKQEHEAILEFCAEHGITSHNIEERLK